MFSKTYMTVFGTVTNVGVMVSVDKGGDNEDRA